MVTVHHLENSRSQRILWLLEELGVTYQIERYGRDKQTSFAPPELTEIHPLGKSPVITDGDITVAESGAIIDYLVHKYDVGRLIPPESSPERLAYNYWLHYAEGTFAPLMLVSLIMGRIESSPMPFFARPVANSIVGKVRGSFLDANIKRNLDFMEATLAESAWFCGEEFTAADVQMSYAIDAAEARTNLYDDYPSLAAYLDKIRARPAYRAALEKGGHYELPVGQHR